MANWQKLERNLVIGMAAGTLLCIAVERANAPTVQRSPATQEAIEIQKLETLCHHAVVCGGIHDLQDIAKGYWPGFDVRTAKHFNLPYGIWGYVTYRDAEGRIQVSHVRREIPKGTEVYEDAFGHTILARCGNEIQDDPGNGSATIVEPNDIFPPIPPDVSETAGVIDFGSNTPTVPNLVDIPPTNGSYTPSYPIQSCCGRVVTNVPEPGELIQCSIGLSALLAFYLFVRNRFRF